MTAAMDNARDSVHRSPPLGVLAIVFVALFVASVAAIFALTGGAPYPTPYRPVEQLQEYYTRFPYALRVVSFLQFGASIVLGLFTATIVSRLMFHGITVAGVFIALFGGMAAAVFLGVSSLAAWVLSQPGWLGLAGGFTIPRTRPI